MDTQLLVILAALLSSAALVVLVKARTRAEFDAHAEMAAIHGLQPVSTSAHEALGLGFEGLPNTGDMRNLLHRFRRAGEPHEIFEYFSWSSGSGYSSHYIRAGALIELETPAERLRIAGSEPWRHPKDPIPTKVSTGMGALDDRFWITGDAAFVKGPVRSKAAEILDLFDRMPKAELELQSSQLLGTSHLLVTHPTSLPIERRLELLEWGQEFAATLGLEVIC